MEGPYTRIFDLAKPYLATRNNELHTRIAYDFAKKLLQFEGGDEAVVLPAITLHDVGWKSIPEELHLKAFGPRDNDMELNRIHEVEGAKTARLILEQVGYDPSLTDQICEIILGHDSRPDALSLNDAIVKDSDRLWRFSPEALQTDPVRFKVDPVDHVVWLGARIQEWFYTDTAHRLAREEHAKRAAFFGVDSE